MDQKELFRETLLLRRGPAGWGLLVAAWLGGGETVVTTTTVLHTIRPLPRARRVAVTDITSAEIVIADYQTSMFGGWEGSRGGLHGAVVESLESPRQTGNRAIRLQLRSGAVVQFATWKPGKVIAAIRTAQVSMQS